MQLLGLLPRPTDLESGIGVYDSWKIFILIIPADFYGHKFENRHQTLEML